MIKVQMFVGVLSVTVYFLGNGRKCSTADVTQDTDTGPWFRSKLNVRQKKDVLQLLDCECEHEEKRDAEVAAKLRS